MPELNNQDAELIRSLEEPYFDIYFRNRTKKGGLSQHSYFWVRVWGWDKVERELNRYDYSWLICDNKGKEIGQIIVKNSEIVVATYDVIFLHKEYTRTYCSNINTSFLSSLGVSNPTTYTYKG